MNKTPQRRGRPAKVETAPSQFRTIDPDVEFAALNSGKMIVDTSPIPGEESGLSGGERPGTVVHTRPGKVWMFKPTDNGYWLPRPVPSTSIAQNLQNGWKSYCPQCNGVHGDGPNDCPGREPVKFMGCPICTAVTWDNYQIKPQQEASGDPNEVMLVFTTSPEQRLRAGLERHGRIRHPAEWDALFGPERAEGASLEDTLAASGMRGRGALPMGVPEGAV